MTHRAAVSRYSTVSIALHWLMLALFIGVYAAIELREFYPRGSDAGEAMKAWHFTLGLSVFALVWLRIVARLLMPTPAPLNEPAWRSLAAKGVHLALYALMIGMPLAGWVILSAEGNAIPFWGFSLPAIAPVDRNLAHNVEELHELGGTLGYWLIGLHAAASLFHHYVLKDGLMRRMMPGPV
ncbi:cytochrome b [Alteraurantiacibacter palmitatis]|uniref:Cytochrome b n=1 Tax=Alteraurantiacibacter palmitatis TaxID=2054628 RepID=A0ABV7EAU6_9SPHN